MRYTTLMDTPTALPRRVKRSLILDPDQIRWIAERAEERSTSDSAIVRYVIRVAMQEDQLGKERAS